MKETEYLNFLKTAPTNHFSDKFIQFLRDNNTVIEELTRWLVIKNVKDPNDYTAFYIDKKKRKSLESFFENLPDLEHYKNREWKIKAPHKRTVKLYHVHLINKN